MIHFGPSVAQLAEPKGPLSYFTFSCPNGISSTPRSIEKLPSQRSGTMNMKLRVSVNLIARNDVAFSLGRRLLHNGPDTVEELLDRHLVKKEKSVDDDEEDELSPRRRRLTSTRLEALSLYRDILRATRFFTWPDSRGVLWRDVLRENARKEFEDARFETDPEIVTRLLIGGRDAVQSALDKLIEKQRQEIEKERGGGDRR
ncbi:hypothetical protein TIFTF001_017955 [Ficus carica]|uniref:Complex 1 LYR protein domain-containing protein n=1 Tax=Ficus carica TaxID=3494 RepID=A0AA88D7H3_FICCA|nr:hypothetical protein TIFTF001_017955 [Ficus carica]